MDEEADRGDEENVHSEEGEDEDKGDVDNNDDDDEEEDDDDALQKDSFSSVA